MNNFDACESQPVGQMSALDQGVASVLREVARYEMNLCRLIAVLESPRPCAEEKCCTKLQPPTLEIGLSELHDSLVKANDLLNHTIKRVEAQVGELKLLP